MLNIRNLTAGYGKTEILHGISLTCQSGSVTTLIGPNGCGKSTLLRTVTGILPLSGGTVELDGVSLRELSKKELAKKVAYLSQGKNLPDITAFRMVLHGRFPYLSYPRNYAKQDFELALSAMEQMGIADLADKNLSQLSGGMRQKVYIAMALCQGADIILLDEPMTYLDIAQQLNLSDILSGLAENGKTVLTVSHDLLSALKSSQSVALMKGGSLLAVSSPSEILPLIPEVFGVEVKEISVDGRKDYIYGERRTV